MEQNFIVFYLTKNKGEQAKPIRLLQFTLLNNEIAEFVVPLIELEERGIDRCFEYTLK